MKKKDLSKLFIDAIFDYHNDKTDIFTATNVCSETCKKIAIEFADYIVKLKDSDIDSINYHFYLNNTNEELFLKFIKEP